MTSSMTTWFAKEPLLPRNLDLEKMFVAEDQTIHLMDANGRVHIVGTLEELRERLQKGDNDSIIYTIMSFPSRVVFCVEVEGYSHTLFMATEKKLGFVENYRNIGRRDSRVVLEEIPSRRQLDSRDHMWCAVAGTGKIIRISPKSEVVGEIYLPDHHEPIDLQFVGNELVILTKRNVAQEEVLLRGGTYHGLVMNAKEASHGNIFTADIGYTGKPGHLYNLGPEELSLLKKSRLLFEKKTGSSAEEVMDFLRTYRRRQPSPNV
ncbi:SMP-30/Gluconolaconase/LRE-like region [Botrytis cinerea]